MKSNFNSLNGKLTKYIGDDKIIIVPEEYITIGMNAFKDNTSAIKIILPEGIREIGWNAFEGCTNLVEINLLNSISKIGDEAFKDCESLIDIKLPENLTVLGSNVFNNCKSLINIIIPNKVSEIGDEAFEGCSSLKMVIILNDNIEIGDDVFSKCDRVVLVCSKDSTAYKYAVENGINYAINNDDLNITEEENQIQDDDVNNLYNKDVDVSREQEVNLNNNCIEPEEAFEPEKYLSKGDIEDEPNILPDEHLIDNIDKLFTDEERTQDTYPQETIEDESTMVVESDDYIDHKKSTKIKKKDQGANTVKKKQKQYKPISFVVTSSGCDDIGSILDSMDIKYDSYNEKGFNCDYLFINCLTRDKIPSDELNKYVKQGGCLYASCYADRIINKAFNNILVTEHSGKTHDENVLIEDYELKKMVGNSINITFDTTWAKLYSARGSTCILKSSQDEQYPIMISMKYGKGMIFYTCFHNHIQMTHQENALLQFLVLRQIGINENISIDEVGNILGVSIEKIKEQLIE